MGRENDGPLDVRLRDGAAVCVIPARAEMDNGNLLCVLSALARQRAAAAAVVVVNNSPLDRTLQSDVYRENRRTLGLLDDLSGRAPGSDSSADGRAAFVRRIRESGLRVDTVDLTGGFERDMARIRNAGLRRAYDLLRERPPRESFVFFLDADCLVGRHFVSGLAKRFRAGAAFLAQPMIYFPWRYDREVVATFARLHVPLMAARVTETLTGGGAARLGAPQLAATVHAWQACGGFPEPSGEEDFEAGRRLDERFGCTFSATPETLVVAGDRAYGAGFEAGARAAGLRDAGDAGPLRVANPLVALAASRAAAGDRSAGDVYRAAEDAGVCRELADFAAVRASFAAALRALFDDANAGGEVLQHRIGRTVGVLERLLDRDARAAADVPPDVRGLLWGEAGAREAYVELAAALLLAMRGGW